MTVDLLLGTVRYALGLALGLAALWKAKDFPAFRASLVGYGLRGWPARAAATAVIAAELVTAVLSFAPAGDQLVGAAGATLGVVFLASQVHVLVTGRQAICLCFGKAAREPVSVRTAARAAFVLLAGFLLLAAGPATAPQFDPLAGALAVALLLVVRWSLRAGAVLRS